MFFKNKNFILAIFSLSLLFLIFQWINYLVHNNYIKEGLEVAAQVTRDLGMPNTTHTVDLPLNTTYSCKNFCGPPNRCAITGQQCTADIDCPGCQPYVPPLPDMSSQNIVGENDAGKLTVGMTPNFSELTTDIGTQATIFTNDKFKKPAMANFGVDNWSAKFEISRKLFDDRYKPAGLNGMPSYPERYSLSGQFIDEGPLASNAYLS